MGLSDLIADWETPTPIGAQLRMFIGQYWDAYSVNFYQISEMDTLLGNKVNSDYLSANFYNRTETNTLLDGKVDNSTLDNYYTQTETNNLLDDKVSSDYLSAHYDDNVNIAFLFEQKQDKFNVGEHLQIGASTLSLLLGESWTFANTTQSTSTTTGALVVGGGLGVGKNLWVGGAINSTGIIASPDIYQAGQRVASNQWVFDQNYAKKNDTAQEITANKLTVGNVEISTSEIITPIQTSGHPCIRFPDGVSGGWAIKSLEGELAFYRYANTDPSSLNWKYSIYI